MLSYYNMRHLSGFQTRNVFCGSQTNNKTLEEKYCEAVLKPRSSQTCHNRKCKGLWKVGNWSEVGENTLQCYWLYILYLNIIL